MYRHGFLKKASHPALALDCRGLHSTAALRRLSAAMRIASHRGGMLKVRSDQRGFTEDLMLWCAIHDFEIVSTEHTERYSTVLIAPADVASEHHAQRTQERSQIRRQVPERQPVAAFA